MKYDQMLVVIKDTACITVSLGGIIYQQVTGNVDGVLLGVYLALLLPAAIPAVRSLRGGGDSATTGPSSPSAPEPPQSPQRSSSVP